MQNDINDPPITIVRGARIYMEFGTYFFAYDGDILSSSVVSDRIVTDVRFIDTLNSRGKPVGWVAYLEGLPYAFPVRGLQRLW